MLSPSPRSPLVDTSPLLRRLRFAAGARVGRSKDSPLVLESRPCFLTLEDLVLSPSVCSCCEVDDARPASVPKNIRVVDFRPPG